MALGNPKARSVEGSVSFGSLNISIVGLVTTGRVTLVAKRCCIGLDVSPVWATSHKSTMRRVQASARSWATPREAVPGTARMGLGSKTRRHTTPWTRSGCHESSPLFTCYSFASLASVRYAVLLGAIGSVGDLPPSRLRLESETREI